MKRKLNIIIKFHRKLSTERSWLPPKITEFSESKDHSIQRLIDFYSKLPQGPFIQPPSKHLFEKYRSTFFNGHGNRQPIFHIITGLIFIGYFLDYHFHLRYHKHSVQN